MTDATMRKRPAGLRRWTVLAALLAVAGWASTLTPASATIDRLDETSYLVAGKSPSAQSTEPPGQPLVGPLPPSPSPSPTGALNETSPPLQAPVDCSRRKCIALTFDDGPGTPTAKLLDILARNRAKATFFLVGQNVTANPAIVRRTLAGGHQLANHSYTHADLGRSSTAKIKSEIGRTQRAVHKATGVWPRLFRPPYGSTDAAVAAVARQNGLPQILWAVDPSDWKDRNAKVVERRVVNGARPGYIVLMHDIHKTTVQAVPAILRRLAAKGYVFVTVAELFRGKTLTPGKKYTKR